MATFVLIPGAGGNASFWQWLVPELDARGHRAIAVDIEQDDPTLGLPEYADCVEQATDGYDDVVLVAQSLGGFTAPMVAQRRPVRGIVLLNAMIPVPGERPGDWWDNTGFDAARRAAEQAAGRDPDFDVERHFLHDIPPDRKAQMLAGPQPRQTADTPFEQPCAFTIWPDVPITVLIGRDDRFFPPGFQRRVAADRIPQAPCGEVPGGHLAAISHPSEVADILVSHLA